MNEVEPGPEQKIIVSDNDPRKLEGIGEIIEVLIPDNGGPPWPENVAKTFRVTPSYEHPDLNTFTEIRPPGDKTEPMVFRHRRNKAISPSNLFEEDMLKGAGKRRYLKHAAEIGAAVAAGAGVTYLIMKRRKKK